jgi:hypothetical protein
MSQCQQSHIGDFDLTLVLWCVAVSGGLTGVNLLAGCCRVHWFRVYFWSGGTVQQDDHLPLHDLMESAACRVVPQN